MGERAREQRFAVAEADLHLTRCVAAEQGVEVGGGGSPGEFRGGQQLGERLLLGRRQAALAAHEGADVPLGARLASLVQKKVPSSGLEALA